MSYFVITGSKQLIKSLQKKVPADYYTDLFIVYKNLPPEVKQYPVQISTITDNEFNQLLIQQKIGSLKEERPVLCKSGIFEGMVGILRKVIIEHSSASTSVNCIVELSTGGGMKMVKLNAEEIKQL